MPTFEDGIERNRKVEMVVQAGQVPSSLTDYELTITESMFPGVAIELLDSDDPNSAQNGGGDVRVALNSDGSNQLAIDVVTFITASGGGECEINALATSFPVDAKVWVFYNTGVTASQPSPSSTFGSDNAYRAAAKLVLTLNEDPSGTAPQFIDRTANANHGTANGGMTSDDSVAGKIGNAVDLDGSNDNISLSSRIGLPGPLTTSSWFNARTTNFVLLGDDQAAFDYHHLFSSNEWWFRTVSGAISRSGPESGLQFQNEWHRFSTVRDASDNVTFLWDGVEFATGTQGGEAGVDTIGAGAGGSTDRVDGLMDIARVYSEALSADYELTRTNNTESPGTFAVAGTPEDTGGGLPIQPTPYYYMMAS